MPIFLAVIAVLFLITALRGNQGAVALQIEQDFLGSTGQTGTGPYPQGSPFGVNSPSTPGGGFLLWVGAIILFGVIGRVLNLDKTFTMFVYLIVAVYLFTKQGIFDQFNQALQSVVAPSAATPAQAGQQNLPPAGFGAAPAPSPFATSTSNPASLLPNNPGAISGGGFPNVGGFVSGGLAGGGVPAPIAGAAGASLGLIFH